MHSAPRHYNVWPRRGFLFRGRAPSARSLLPLDPAQTRRAKGGFEASGRVHSIKNHQDEKKKQGNHGSDLAGREGTWKK